MGVKDNLTSVKNRIRAACDKAGRTDDIQLVAVSKTFPVSSIYPALQAGQRLFGENRVQEAADKWPPLKEEFPDIELHLIGPLQTNKVSGAVKLFDCIQTLDRPKLVKALAKELARQEKTMSAYIQVNIGAEPQKAGIAISDFPAFLSLCRNVPELDIVGLMCIPPFGQDPQGYFDKLAQMARDYGLSNLSMGMSGDFEQAIQSGATHIRVGTAIFGKR